LNHLLSYHGEYKNTTKTDAQKRKKSAFLRREKERIALDRLMGMGHAISGCSIQIQANQQTQQKEKERQSMSNSKNSNRIVVPGAREAMDKFKMEAANEVGVNLKQGYNGDLTSRQAGSVGGQMVKKMIESYENGMK